MKNKVFERLDISIYTWELVGARGEKFRLVIDREWWYDYTDNNNK